MGTRADFYQQDGGELVWIGSIGWDGYPSGIDDKLLQAKSESDYLAAVAEFFKPRKDVTLPEQGWPWPWDDSCTTDYAYCFRDDGVYAWCFGRGPFPAWVDQPEENDGAKDSCFPNMKDIKNVTLGNRSGLLVFAG